MLRGRGSGGDETDDLKDRQRDLRVGVEVLGVCGKARDPERGTETQRHWDRDRRGLRLREEDKGTKIY